MRHAGSQFQPHVAAALEIVVRRRLPSETSEELFDGLAVGLETESQPAEIGPIAALHRIASEISTIRDLDAFLESAARIISEELNYDNVDVLVPSDSGAHLVVRGRVGMREHAARDWSIPADQGIAGEVVRTARPIIDSNGAIAVPLIVEGTIVGVVAVESPRVHAFTMEDARNLTVIAAQLAPAVELARVHDQAKRAAQRDGLTGIYNHASFYERLEEVLEGETPSL